MKLYYFETMNPRKACTTAKYLGLDLGYVRVDLAKGEHRAADYLGLNPNGKVPTLVDGERTLWESASICAYLAGKAGSDLWPVHDYAAQAEIMRWISWGGAHWAPSLGVFYFEHYVKRLLGMGGPDSAKLAAVTPQFHVVAKVLDGELAGRSYLACGRLTIADFIVAAMLPDWRALGVPLADYTNIRRWHDDGLQQIDAFREPWPAA